MALFCAVAARDASDEARTTVWANWLCCAPGWNPAQLWLCKGLGHDPHPADWLCFAGMPYGGLLRPIASSLRSAFGNWPRLAPAPNPQFSMSHSSHLPQVWLCFAHALPEIRATRHEQRFPPIGFVFPRVGPPMEWWNTGVVEQWLSGRLQTSNLTLHTPIYPIPPKVGFVLRNCHGQRSGPSGLRTGRRPRCKHVPHSGTFEMLLGLVHAALCPSRAWRRGRCTPRRSKPLIQLCDYHTRPMMWRQVKSRKFKPQRAQRTQRLDEGKK